MSGETANWVLLDIPVKFIKTCISDNCFLLSMICE